MTKIITGLSTSLDGFIAGADTSPARPLGVGGERLFDWFRDGGTPSRFYQWMRMSAPSAEFFDNHARRVGVIITGRRTYDVSAAWGGAGPLRGVPLFVIDGVEAGSVDLELAGVVDAPGVTHLAYRVVK